MNTKHTPGPWKYHESKTERNVFFVTYEKVPVAKVAMAFTENESNARLISAAPELLEALEMIVADFEASGFANPEELVWWDKACAAIAKAKATQK